MQLATVDNPIIRFIISIAILWAGLIGGVLLLQFIEWANREKKDIPS